MQEPGRGPQDAQRQTVARRMFSAKPRPAGCATPNRGPQDVQDKRVGIKGVLASAALRGAAKCAAGDTGLGLRPIFNSESEGARAR